MSSGNVWSPFIFTVLLLKMHQYVANTKCLQKLSETVPDSNRIILLYNIEMRLITTALCLIASSLKTYLSKKLHDNQSVSHWVMVVTDRQTDKPRQIPTCLDRGNY